MVPATMELRAHAKVNWKNQKCSETGLKDPRKNSVLPMKVWAALLGSSPP
jgi:hypothetical protein